MADPGQAQDKAQDKAQDNTQDKAQDKTQDKAQSKKKPPVFVSLSSVLETQLTREALMNRPRKLPTGFEGLDKELGGGLSPGLIILGGSPNLGKSTFAIQLADFLSQQVPVLYYSMEMTPDRIAAKLVSRELFLQCGKVQGGETPMSADNIISNARLFSREDWERIDRVRLQVQARTRNLFVIEKLLKEDGASLPFTAKNITDHVRRFADQQRKAPEPGIPAPPLPLVIVDYLQILQSPDQNRNERQAVEDSLNQLVALAREGYIVILISSLSRGSYDVPLRMDSFKETGGIEYSADVLLGLQFQATQHLKKGQKLDLQAEKRKNPREVELAVLKQRYGSSENSVPLLYYARYDCFESDLRSRQPIPGVPAASPGVPPLPQVQEDPAAAAMAALNAYAAAQPAAPAGAQTAPPAVPPQAPPAAPIAPAAQGQTPSVPPAASIQMISQARDPAAQAAPAPAPSAAQRQTPSVSPAPPANQSLNPQDPLAILAALAQGLAVDISAISPAPPPAPAAPKEEAAPQEQEPEQERIPRRSFYLNNTLIASQIRQGVWGEDKACMVLPDPGVSTSFSLSTPLNGFDCAILDAVCTLFQEHRKEFSLGQVLRILSGDRKQTITPQKKQELRDSINKLRVTRLEIRCTQEMQIRKRLGQDQELTLQGPVLALDEKPDRYLFRSGAPSPLYEYSRMSRQIVSFPEELLQVALDGQKLHDSADVICLKRFLIRRLEYLRRHRDQKKPDRPAAARSVSFQPDSELCRELALQNRFPQKPDQVQKLRKLQKAAVRILTYYRQIGYIANFQAAANGTLRIQGEVQNPWELPQPSGKPET